MTTEENVEDFVLVDQIFLGPKVTKYVVKARDIARRRRPGQFVIVRAFPESERIPLTIADANAEEGTITLIVQELGKSTAEMAHIMRPGDKFADVLGPLGLPTHIEKVGRVLGVGGGIGVAPLHPIVQGMKNLGNHVVGILGARTKDLMIMEDEMRAACDDVRIVTDDGSYGVKGLVTDAIKADVEENGKPDLVVAIGPLVMMRAVSNLTKELGIKTLVSLNPIMVDGTGMCGGCRVSVHGETKFACVDGPEFDAHGVDFDELLRRQRFYTPQERAKYDKFIGEHPHDAAHCKIHQMADAAEAERSRKEL